jgi:hypothetical protein
MAITMTILFFFRITPSVPFTTRTLDKTTVLGEYALPKGVSRTSPSVPHTFQTIHQLSLRHFSRRALVLEICAGQGTVDMSLSTELEKKGYGGDQDSVPP